MARNNVSIGLLIVAAGIVILLGKLGVFSFLGWLLWPMFIIVPGLLLHYLYFSRVLPSAALIPGGILTVYGGLFFFCNLFGSFLYQYLWPIFIFGVAVGLYEYYFFDRNHPRPAFVAAAILAIISGIFFAFMILFSAAVYAVAFALIIGGALLLYKRPKAW